MKTKKYYISPSSEIFATAESKIIAASTPAPSDDIVLDFDPDIEEEGLGE